MLHTKEKALEAHWGPCWFWLNLKDKGNAALLLDIFPPYTGKDAEKLLLGLVKQVC